MSMMNLSRRATLSGLAATLAMPHDVFAANQPLITGAEAWQSANFAPLNGKRIGLITNQTGRLGNEHLVDVLARSTNIKLVSILAPEHGFRGQAEAGVKVKDNKDPKTGLPVLSLYGQTRKPTPAMLKGLDALVFDIQDVGVRSYTYISTMGLAMQAASEARIPFVVLDRPNPLGGDYVSGYVLEPALKSFVGQYPIPIVHGMTVAELASMIKGERWLPGLDNLDLSVAKIEHWSRTMRWHETRQTWIPTSPNVPTFASALAYPGVGLVGETLVNEGRGTPTPFQLFGAPWLDAKRAAAKLNSTRFYGALFSAETYTPRSIPNVAADPRFKDQTIPGVRLTSTDVNTFHPLESGIHALVELHT
ncbi:MAG: exo-beta-N-acetylmuramidase NamZ domain-containing protein, partial [Hyphomicrobiaceae bacterium]